MGTTKRRLDGCVPLTPVVVKGVANLISCASLQHYLRGWRLTTPGDKAYMKVLGLSF